MCLDEINHMYLGNWNLWLCVIWCDSIEFKKKKVFVASLYLIGAGLECYIENWAGRP